MDEMPPDEGSVAVTPPQGRPRRRSGRLKGAMRRFKREQRHLARLAVRFAPPPEGVPCDVDALLRDRLTLQPLMQAGTRGRHWRGCRERACRRARVCLAPRRVCPSPGGGGDNPSSAR